jgi:hypothetical protein
MPISIQEARKLVEHEEDYSDAEMEEIIHQFKLLAELTFDCWHEEQKEK